MVFSAARRTSLVWGATLFFYVTRSCCRVDNGDETGVKHSPQKYYEIVGICSRKHRACFLNFCPPCMRWAIYRLHRLDFDSNRDGSATVSGKGKSLLSSLYKSFNVKAKLSWAIRNENLWLRVCSSHDDYLRWKNCWRLNRCNRLSPFPSTSSGHLTITIRNCNNSIAINICYVNIIAANSRELAYGVAQ